MYPPPHHQTTNIQKMIEVISEFPLGMLVSVHMGKPIITHIPFIYSEASGKLITHIDAQNPQLESLTNGAEVTVVFRGPDAYISPSIYSTAQLPTWNYIIVHITGEVSRIDDPEKAKETMVHMTRFLEKEDSNYMLHLDDPKMNRFINYIQAFEITITNWEGKFKLSQDKNPTDYENARQELIQKSAQNATDFLAKIYRTI